MNICYMKIMSSLWIRYELKFASSIHRNSTYGNGWHIVHPYKLFTSYIKYDDDFNGSLNKCIYLLLARVYLSKHWLRPQCIPRSMNRIISMSVSNSNFTCVYFNIASHIKLPSLVVYNNTRDRVHNWWCNYCENSQKYRPTARHLFSNRLLYSSNVRIENCCDIYSRRERNRSLIWYHLSMNYKMIHAIVIRFPSRSSQHTHTEIHLYMWENRNSPHWGWKILIIQFSVYLYRDTTSIYRGLY